MNQLLPFLSFLQRFVDITEAEFKHFILPLIEVRRYNKRDIILRDGELEIYQNYVLSGLVRKYYIKKGDEFITQIAKEGHIINVQESFFSGTPSDFCLEALEPTVLVSMNRQNLDNVFESNAKMERLGRLVVTFIMVVKDEWQMKMIHYSPRERFVDFVNKNAELVQRLPQKYLASYLNIQPETFSRFKHLLRERKTV